jgi:hypothetical protein
VWFCTHAGQVLSTPPLTEKVSDCGCQGGIQDGRLEEIGRREHHPRKGRPCFAVRWEGSRRRKRFSRKLTPRGFGHHAHLFHGQRRHCVTPPSARQKPTEFPRLISVHLRQRLPETLDLLLSPRLLRIQCDACQGQDYVEMLHLMHLLPVIMLANGTIMHNWYR